MTYCHLHRQGWCRILGEIPADFVEAYVGSIQNRLNKVVVELRSKLGFCSDYVDSTTCHIPVVLYRIWRTTCVRRPKPIPLKFGKPFDPWQVIVLTPNDVHVDASRLKILNNASIGVQWVGGWVERWIWLVNDVKLSDAKLLSTTPILYKLSLVCRRL